MRANHCAREPEVVVFPCLACDGEYDAWHLFVVDIKELARIKGLEEGKEIASIFPEDLPDFAVCADCRDPDEKYTLASAMESSRRYWDRRRRPQTKVSAVETEEPVCCFLCAELGKTTTMPRSRANTPNWAGCNILKGSRFANQQNSGQLTLAYVSSADLLKGGKEGFVACDGHMDGLISELRNKARALGSLGKVIAARIEPRPLLAMIGSVRRKEARRIRGR